MQATSRHRVRGQSRSRQALSPRYILTGVLWARTLSRASPSGCLPRLSSTRRSSSVRTMRASVSCFSPVGSLLVWKMFISVLSAYLRMECTQPCQQVGQAREAIHLAACAARHAVAAPLLRGRRVRQHSLAGARVHGLQVTRASRDGGRRSREHLQDTGQTDASSSVVGMSLDTKAPEN